MKKTPKFDCKECQYISDYMDLDGEGECCGVCGRKIKDIKNEWDNLFKFLNEEYFESKVSDLYEKYENKEINEKRKLSELTVNDKVYVDCMSSLGASSCGYSLISEVVKKFDENTGEEYKVFLVDDRKFDSRNGSEIRKDGIGMFYIESV